MMMAKADEGSSPGITNELFGADDEYSDDVFVDLEAFLQVLDGPPVPGPEQGGASEDLPFNSEQGLQNLKDLESPRAESPGFGLLSPSCNSEASESRTGCSDGFTESAGNSIADGERLELASQRSFVENSCSRSVTDCTPVQHDRPSYTYPDGTSHVLSSYCLNDSEKVPSGTPKHFKNSDWYCHDLWEANKLLTSVVHMDDSYFIDGDMASYGASHTPSGSCGVNGALVRDLSSEDSGLYPLSSDDQPYFAYTSGFGSLSCDRDTTIGIIDEVKDPTENLISNMDNEDLVLHEFLPHMAKRGNVSTMSINSNIGAFGNMYANGDEYMKLHFGAPSNVFNEVQDDIDVKRIELIKSNELVSRDSEVIGDVISRNYGGADKLPASASTQWSASNFPSLSSCKKYVNGIKDETEMLSESKGALLSLGMVGDPPTNRSSIVAHNWHPVPLVSGQPGILPYPSIKAGINCLNIENEVPKFNSLDLSNVSYRRLCSWGSMFEPSNFDDDSDVCILEDMSTPARTNLSAMNDKLVAASQFPVLREPIGQMALRHSRVKSNDEQAIFRVALQDLSQPNLEATPPDGALAVPLLRHQRIALSWMVNKETKGACCSGGILADDQGLGKTVSTIALILKERSLSKALKTTEDQSETEMLNLDEDDDSSVTYHVKEPHEVHGENTCLQAKGRPAAGTLIVCPTSVLRQWSEELHSKVTKEADLSVLVYHGPSRTKDPLELAKYDVVITTYAIVKLEVPKQPVVDENDDQTPFKGFSSSKKRKLLDTVPGKKQPKSKKSKKEIENELFETMSGPLAKVGWFRIVLDEAQSIKNYSTQTARACWGLRAKRRWCLSGTPIQNAIDDLYSYFRFLRYEPYANFKTFCEQIKAPIHRNPKDGYKKLQAVLKTIMLRRTKGTFIDGEPIINLPPKTIELKIVDFSKEERDFYCRLEADSRAQFAEYAAAGTVKQNYVNILLMLLRLRQACDHPLLVKGFNSYSNMISSTVAARKLPREKLIFLMNYLEASRAICGVCSDPPEEAVVTVCGHVFCNQCICEHMIADGTQCPCKSCKTNLSMSQVFSLNTLQIAISDQPTMENTLNGSDSELANVSEGRSLSCPEDSSKIKAALEILLSLSKPLDCALRMRSSGSIKEGFGSEVLLSSDSGKKFGNLDMKTDPKSPVKFMGEKAIVFSQWTRMLDLLETCLKKSSVQYRRLDGTMPVVARDRAVKDFNSLPQVTVMIMSLKAASLGLNMVAACNVLLLDLWWNPTTEDQAIDRAHRIGQTRPVSVFRLTVKDTVEDRILALQQKKREMVASAFGEDGTGSRQTRLTVDDLKYLFSVD